VIPPLALKMLSRKEMKIMKKSTLSIPLVFLLLLAFTISPVLAAKNTWNIEYTLSGSIWNTDSTEYGKGSGVLSVIVRGKVVGNPDYSMENSVEDASIGYGYGIGGSYDYWEDEIHYQVEYFSEVNIVGLASYTEYVDRWYNPQPKFNGKIVAIWEDGSTSFFNVDLSPGIVEKTSREGEVQGTYSYYTIETVYIETDEGWELVKEDITEGSEDFAYDYSESNVYIDFSGKINDKGRSPYKGTLELWDVVSANYKMGYGTFGPYDLSIYQYTRPQPTPPPA